MKNILGIWVLASSMWAMTACSSSSAKEEELKDENKYDYRILLPESFYTQQNMFAVRAEIEIGFRADTSVFNKLTATTVSA